MLDFPCKFEGDFNFWLTFFERDFRFVNRDSHLTHFLLDRVLIWPKQEGDFEIGVVRPTLTKFSN